MNPRLSFEAHACGSQARAAGLGDVTVTIRHIPTSTVFLLSKEDARAFAFCILKATDPERDTWTVGEAPASAVAPLCKCGHGDVSHRHASGMGMGIDGGHGFCRNCTCQKWRPEAAGGKGA